MNTQEQTAGETAMTTISKESQAKVDKMGDVVGKLCRRTGHPEQMEPGWPQALERAVGQWARQQIEATGTEGDADRIVMGSGRTYPAPGRMGWGVRVDLAIVGEGGANPGERIYEGLKEGWDRIGERAGEEARMPHFEPVFRYMREREWDEARSTWGTPEARIGEEGEVLRAPAEAEPEMHPVQPPDLEAQREAIDLQIRSLHAMMGIVGETLVSRPSTEHDGATRLVEGQRTAELLQSMPGARIGHPDEREAAERLLAEAGAPPVAREAREAAGGPTPATDRLLDEQLAEIASGRVPGDPKRRVSEPVQMAAAFACMEGILSRHEDCWAEEHRSLEPQEQGTLGERATKVADLQNAWERMKDRDTAQTTAEFVEELAKARKGREVDQAEHVDLFKAAREGSGTLTRSLDAMITRVREQAWRMTGKTWREEMARRAEGSTYESERARAAIPAKAPDQAEEARGGNGMWGRVRPGLRAGEDEEAAPQTAAAMHAARLGAKTRGAREGATRPPAGHGR